MISPLASRWVIFVLAALVCIYWQQRFQWHISWLLFNYKWAICDLIRGEITVHVDDKSQLL